MNEQQKKEYLDNQGEKCPFCKRPSVCGGDALYTDNTAIHLTAWCAICDEVWTDIYHLVDVRV